MAKILVITRKKDEVLENLMAGLETDIRDLLLITTEETKPAKWVHLMAELLKHQPELIYFVIADDQPNLLEKTLFRILSRIPQFKVAVSFLGQVNFEKSNSLLSLCRQADILTLPTRESLTELRGFRAKTKRQFRALLPPPVPVPNISETLQDSTAEFLKYVNQTKTWTTLWDIDFFKKHLTFFESRSKEISWVFIGDRSQWKFKDFDEFQNLTANWKKPPLWFQDSSNVALYELFKSTELLFLPGLKINPGELLRVTQLAVLRGLFTILDTHQIESTSRFWTVGENCELIDFDDVSRALNNQWPVRDFSSLNLRKKPRNPARGTDDTLNELSRWFSQSLIEPKRI
ncbi:MAG: hypothetical protein ACK5V3_10915 [Bdellovibrionales bacterium]